MTPIIDFLVNFWPSLLIGVVPLAACLIAAGACSSWRRVVALALAVPTAAIFAFEIYSKTQDGNLTGLLWILSAPIVVIGVIALIVMDYFSVKSTGNP